MVWNLKHENSNFSTISLFLLVDEKSALLPIFQALEGFFKLYIDLVVEKKRKKSQPKVHFLSPCPALPIRKVWATVLSKLIKP